MSRYFGVALTALAMSGLLPDRALAGISSDLRYCGGLKNSKERLACYDAAARIEGQPRVQRAFATAPFRPALPPKAPAPHYPPKSKFEGLYATITGGYDASVAAPNASVPNIAIWHTLTDPGAIKGGKLGAALGYNAVSGRLLIGFEGRAQYAFSSDTNGYTSEFGSTNLPKLVGGCSFGCSPASYPTSYPSTLVSAVTYDEKISRPWSADVSARAGLIFDDWLIFGRGGLGLESTRRTATADQSKSVTCINTTYSYVPSTIRPGSLDYLISGCGALQSGSSTTTVVSVISPTVTIAAGVERNFGDVFVRAEAELLVHLPSYVNRIYYSPSVNVAVGYRF